MSDGDEADKKSCCASCGITEVDNVKLVPCDDCDLVKYCSDECQKDHRPKHKKECQKRAAELHDEILFKQPESSLLGDCPICCLPIPLDPGKYYLNECCCKRICEGCNIANKKREIEGRLQFKCAFCRKASPQTQDESNERTRKRVEANDPVALCFMGTKKYYDEGDYTAAFEYWSRAVALGDVLAHFQLSTLYGEGKGVEKDEKKVVYHSEKAAIGGHPDARYNLGFIEEKNGNKKRAAKHFIIAAKLGYDKSLANVKMLYKDGYVSKEDFAAALRGHQAAVDATRSPQREFAAKFFAEIVGQPEN